MVYISIIIGCIIGAIIGLNSPIIPYTYSSYLAIAIIAALDTVFGGIASVIKGNFDLKIFLTGFFGIFVSFDLHVLLDILFEQRIFGRRNLQKNRGFVNIHHKFQFLDNIIADN